MRNTFLVYLAALAVVGCNNLLTPYICPETYKIIAVNQKYGDTPQCDVSVFRGDRCGEQFRLVSTPEHHPAVDTIIGQRNEVLVAYYWIGNNPRGEVQESLRVLHDTTWIFNK